MGKTLFELAKQAQPDYPHQIILATKPIGEV